MCRAPSHPPIRSHPARHCRYILHPAWHRKRHGIRREVTTNLTRQETHSAGRLSPHALADELSLSRLDAGPQPSGSDFTGSALPRSEQRYGGVRPPGYVRRSSPVPSIWDDLRTLHASRRFWNPSPSPHAGPHGPVFPILSKKRSIVTLGWRGRLLGRLEPLSRRAGGLFDD